VAFSKVNFYLLKSSAATPTSVSVIRKNSVPPSQRTKFMSILMLHRKKDAVCSENRIEVRDGVAKSRVSYYRSWVNTAVTNGLRAVNSAFVS
jgi:hypothetical protein